MSGWEAGLLGVMLIPGRVGRGSVLIFLSIGFILPSLHLSGRYEMLRGGKKTCVNESLSNSSSGIQTDEAKFFHPVVASKHVL